MTEKADELLQLIPWYWGMLWMSTEDTHESHEVHMLTPRVVAMMELAEQRPEEFRARLHAANEAASRRYGFDFESELITSPRQLRQVQRFELLARLAPELKDVLRWARQFSEHWHAQEGVNAGILDALDGAVRRFEEAMRQGEKDPESGR